MAHEEILFYFKHWCPFCSAELNSLCNFGTGCYKKHFREIILNFGQWLKRCHFKKFLFCALTAGILCAAEQNSLCNFGRGHNVCLFVCFCCFTSQVNNYGHGGTVSSLNKTFSWASLNKQLTSTSCTYFRL